MNTKKCFKCNNVKELSHFYKHPQMSDGHVNKCKECNKSDVRNNYSNNKEYYKSYDLKRNRYNFNYIFINRYSGIKSRSTDCNKRKYNVYGKELCSKEDFMKWCNDNIEVFEKIWKEWEKSNFSEKFSPSIDRINNNLGYTTDNMQWLPKYLNCIKYTK